jgi:hypothetical protein
MNFVFNAGKHTAVGKIQVNVTLKEANIPSPPFPDPRQIGLHRR